MTVGAQEHALPRLGAHPGNAPRHTAMAQMKSLRGRITMMKLKRGLVLIESANPAAPPCLLDKPTLNLTTALGNCSDAALCTSKSSVGALEEARMPMLCAAQIHLLETRPARGFTFATADRSANN